MKKSKTRRICASALTSALLLSLLLLCGGCAGTSETETDTATTETVLPGPNAGSSRGGSLIEVPTVPPIDEDDPDAEIKRLYYGAYNGTEDGALVLDDGVAYQRKQSLLLPIRGKNSVVIMNINELPLHEDLRILRLDGDRTAEPFCTVEGCAHDVPWCVSFIAHFDNQGLRSLGGNTLSAPLLVEPESMPGESRMYAVHTAIGAPEKGMYGLSDNWFAYDSGALHPIVGSQVSLLFEYDLNRGTRRAVLKVPFSGAVLDDVDLYYNGIVYCAGEPNSSAGIEVAVDSATGEYSVFDYKCHVNAVGVYDGRIIIFADDGAVFSCSADLKDRKLITKLDNYDVWAFRTMCGDKVLFKRYREDDTCDICALDLSSDSYEEQTIIENVRGTGIYVYKNYVYYLVRAEGSEDVEGDDQDDFDTALYRYDTETGRRETVVEKYAVYGTSPEIIYADDEIVDIRITDPVFTEETEREDDDHYVVIYWGGVLRSATLEIELGSGKIRAYDGFLQ